MKKIRFLTFKEVIRIHTKQIELYGGLDGIRDMGLLQSALAQPEAKFSGSFLHQSLEEKAAAYAYHLCLNHPFIDGNKRTALVSTYVFLILNKKTLITKKESIEQLILDIANKKIAKNEIAKLLLIAQRDGTCR